MKVFNSLVSIINCFMVIVFLIWFALWSLNVVDLSMIEVAASKVTSLKVSDFELGRAISAGLAIWILLLNVSNIILNMVLMRQELSIVSKSQQGEVCVSVAAIGETINRLIRSLPEISGSFIEINRGKGSNDKKIKILAGISVYESLNIKDVTTKVTELINARFQELVDVGEPPDVVIKVSKIIEKKSPGKPAKKDKGSGRVVTFSGPVYPIDSD